MEAGRKRQTRQKDTAKQTWGAAPDPEVYRIGFQSKKKRRESRTALLRKSHAPLRSVFTVAVSCA
jgi:hypothetical protein